MTTSAISTINREENPITERADGSAEFTISSQFSCTYEARERVLWSKWTPRGIPSFNIDLLRDLELGSQVIEEYFSNPADARHLNCVILRSGASGAFSVGGDLGYFERLILSQNRARLAEYARAAINVQYRNYTAHNLAGVTTVALLEDDALGGGLECALSCDIVVAERHVKAGFPEVLFSMFPGMGGISFLTRRVGRATANEMVRTGRQYTALELLELGVVDEVVETGQGVDAVTKLIRKRQHQHAAHAAINAVDRLIHPVTLQELHDVVQIWVDCALKLSPRSLEWMHRLYQRQLAIFGKPLQIASESSTTSIDSRPAIAA